MKMNDNVAYASLPREFKGRRNMVVVGARKDHGRFRSGRANKSEVYCVMPVVLSHNPLTPAQGEPETPIFELAGEDVPSMYRRVEIAYSKFGVEDFDFGLALFNNEIFYKSLC
jgi:PAB-dependent poly(A)-specific ribonuclease subunit 2